ncbi:MAG: hypothetical protein JJE30_08860 [Desulfuromonadales bacterium]|nr:hypothetical protein [Desulfuromonadales bacterium]
MALINHAKREINAKIIYYGREGVGKRASLQYIYDRIKPALRGELKTLPTGADALLFFDFSPFEKLMFGGYRIRFHVYSLPGKVVNPATWKMTLKGADGLVIVADAAPEMLPAARESISRLREFLAAYGVGLHDIPCVLQLNRISGGQQSPACLTAAELEVPDMQTCLCEPAAGEGILEVLSLLSRVIMTRIGQSDALRAPKVVEPSDGTENSDRVILPPPLGLEELLMPPDAVKLREEDSVAHAARSEDADENLQVTLAVERAESSNGVVRIPLELTLGGETRRLVVSITIDQV